MQIRFQQSPTETKQMDTTALRTNFLIESVFSPNQIQLTYSHYDRVIIGGVMPVDHTVELPNEAELRAAFFLERREIGIVNVGGPGQIIVNGETMPLEKLDALYIGKGVEHVSFGSLDAQNPAQFYLLSAQAHAAYPTRLMRKDEASPTAMGAGSTANERIIYKYIHADGIQSAQLVMGLTVLAPGSVWNTMPAHTHTRRMEAYFYFDVPQDHRVVHLMGEPKETRHLIVENHQAVISAPWSIHSGCGTSNYGFIWGMAGENYTYTDMDPAPANALL